MLKKQHNDKKMIVLKENLLKKDNFVRNYEIKLYAESTYLNFTINKLCNNGSI